MIKINELRIGNFIFDDDGIIAKVIGFKPYDHSVRCDEEEGCDISVDLYPQDGNVRHALLCESTLANPIPLTPEWLERLGFVKDSRSVWVKRIDEYTLIGINMDGKYELIDVFNAETVKSWDNRIEFVHQLQNLYFALTGEELEIKLT
jgi:hypothetical protein